MKWTIAMTQAELYRKTVVEKVLDKRITQKAGAKRLGVTERQFRRILSRYRQEGDSGLVSRHRNRSGNRKLKEEQRREIIEFIQDPVYNGFGPTLLLEKLVENRGVTVCKETLRQIMIEAGKHHPKIKKEKEHNPRERREKCGELVQIDGSEHDWLEQRGPKGTLLLFVDDATSAVLAGEFVEHESFFAYSRLCKSYFRSTGLPVAFYSDRLGVFRVNHKTNASKEAITQFRRALTSLGVELIYAHSPQAKGRIERTNQTFQDRLVKEMRLLGIADYHSANAYRPEFIRIYSRKFAVLPRSTGDLHAPLDKEIDLDFLFSIHDTRVIKKGLLIDFAGVTYQIITTRPPRNLVKRDVLIALDEFGKVSAYLGHERLTLQPVQKQPKQFKVVSKPSLDPEPYIPPINHPWRTYGKKINGQPVLLTE